MNGNIQMRVYRRASPQNPQDSKYQTGGNFVLILHPIEPDKVFVMHTVVCMHGDGPIADLPYTKM